MTGGPKPRFAGTDALMIARRYSRGESVNAIAESVSAAPAMIGRVIRKQGVRLCRRGPVRRSLESRFWGFVTRGAAHECWPFTGCKNACGYGSFRFAGKSALAHRMAFYLTHGYWPEVARHTCNNPPCCNPTHLIDGTQADNIRDMAESGRARRGVSHRSARLTESDVMDIRTLLGLCRVSDLARAYGVSYGCMSKIKYGRSWRHV
jgi:hypothetical protein